MTTQLGYWYDAQLERFLEQFTRIFAGLEYEYLFQGQAQRRRVVARAAGRDRMVQQIRRGNSENIIFSVPAISTYIQDLRLNETMNMAPGLTETYPIVERDFNPITQQYTNQSGERYELTRLAPTPIKIVAIADIWTSNTVQKHQIIEQLLVLFPHGVDIQLSRAIMDWTAIASVALTDINYDESGVNLGTNDPINICKMTFDCQTYINPPALLNRQTHIERVIVESKARQSFVNDFPANILVQEGEGLPRVVVTPGNNNVKVVGNVLTLLGPNSNETNDQGELWNWASLLEQYDQFQNNISQISFNTSGTWQDGDIVSGLFQFTGSVNQLTWTPDILTLPISTLADIRGLINPLEVFPGSNRWPSVSTGDRFIVTQSHGDGINSTQAWGTLKMRAGDIIEFNGSGYAVVWTGGKTTEYVNNAATGQLLKWSGKEWISAIDGIYSAGDWRFLL